MAPAAHTLPQPQPDLYRDTWLRYLGYANEVGEAFRAHVPSSVVWASYAVASGYVVADAVDKGKKATSGLASVAIPGFTINRVCAACHYVLGAATRLPLATRKWTTTTLGLLVIPVIIHPIDKSVDFLLDNSLRKLYPTQEKPSSA
ncbi:mitochondrial fission process protein 1 isoform X2 [Tachyglossus aculeatus]|uniref:mitochondrial fission process protein 1 isoform X2 n=1 Tax=Tachyglossus aculeatus TaxID=9261 RepID=UPI0018F35EFE|nr:mitochondrial fission process protein 1 isoform X2 [Tachyglossus aculeatus]